MKGIALALASAVAGEAREVVVVEQAEASRAQGIEIPPGLFEPGAFVVCIGRAREARRGKKVKLALVRTGCIARKVNSLPQPAAQRG
jgi:hypothetical protein